MLGTRNAAELTSSNLKSVLQLKGISAADLANRLGTSRTTVSRWLNGHNRITPGRLQQVADALGVAVEQLTDAAAGIKARSADVFSNMIVVANVPAGAPEINYEDGAYFSEVMELDASCFALRVTGDSMSSEYVDKCIPSGAWAVLRGAPTDINECVGRVVYASVDDGEYSLKELVHLNGRYVLRPWNRLYSDIPVTENTRILGVVIGWYVKPLK